MSDKKAMESFDVEDVLIQLTMSEKIGLLSGRDFWHTASISRLKVPSIRMSDGPNGVRGTRFFNGPPAACLPCGTALGATWDTNLIHAAGKLLAGEAKVKGVHILLGPTVNIHRSPLGGRGFESFSEDPFLSGTLAAAQIKSLQAEGVGSALKHFVCNDQEHERKLYNAVVSERALREIYLSPFQIAVRDAEPWAIMACYNKVNGRHVSESSKFLEDLLRKEWGFKGAVISDWFGTYSVSGSVNAGLDLEMPGPAIWRGPLLRRAIQSGKVESKTLDERVRKVLRMINQATQSGTREDAEEGTANTTESSELLRELASASITLLKNEHSTLPFKKHKKTVVIGPNAKYVVCSGGGSAALNPYYVTSPSRALLQRTDDGRLGFDLKIYHDHPECQERQMVDKVTVDDTLVMLVDYKHPEIAGFLFYADLEAKFTPDEDGDFEFGLSVNGTGKLFIDDQLVVDNETIQHSGNSFLGVGTREEVGIIHLKAGKTYRVLVRFGTAPTQRVTKPGGGNLGAGGFRLGCVRKFDPAKELERAIIEAKGADQVIVCVGLSAGSEAEGRDRRDMGLGEAIDNMISEVLAANPNSAVVVQSGTPVSMPWAEKAPAILHAWYGGSEGGNAIADILFGDTNPSGKLPLTFPIRNEDNPAFLNFRSERGRTIYGEDIFVGYRFYEKTARPVLFPFGHGLSYSSFAFANLELVASGDDRELKINVDVANEGEYDGAEVVQVYVKHHEPSIIRPVKELKGFQKVFVRMKESRKVVLTLDKRSATSFWDESRSEWTMEKGLYEVQIGPSSSNILLTKGFRVENTCYWRGL